MSRTPFPRTTTILALILIALILATSALASDPPGEVGDRGERNQPAESEEPRGWEPALSIGVGIFGQNIEMGLESTAVVVTESADGSLLTGVGDFGLALYSPPLIDTELSPRIVLRGGALVPVAGDATIVTDARSLTVDSDLVAFCGATPGSGGSCSRSILAESTHLYGWYAGLGLDFRFPLEFIDTDLHLRPTIDYFGEQIEFKWQASTTLFTRVFNPTPPPTIITQIDEEMIGVSSKEIFHGLGPGLTAEVEVLDMGATHVVLFAESRVYFMLSDREVAKTIVNGSDLTTLSAKIALINVVGGAGLRFVWR